MDFRTEVLLSLQRALWGMVTPQLRGATASFAYPTIGARFFYEQVSQAEWDCVDYVETSVVADFLPDVVFDFCVVNLPISLSRQVLLAGEEWVYLRNESQDSEVGVRRHHLEWPASNDNPLVVRTHVLLSLQQALLNMVTPPLRGVSVKIEDCTVNARFIYEYISVNERRIVDDVRMLVEGDVGPDLAVNFVAVGVPSGEDAEVLLPGEEWIFLRFEPPGPEDDPPPMVN